MSGPPAYPVMRAGNSLLCPALHLELSDEVLEGDGEGGGTCNETNCFRKLQQETELRPGRRRRSVLAEVAERHEHAQNGGTTWWREDDGVVWPGGLPETVPEDGGGALVRSHGRTSWRGGGG